MLWFTTTWVVAEQKTMDSMKDSAHVESPSLADDTPLSETIDLKTLTVSGKKNQAEILRRSAMPVLVIEAEKSRQQTADLGEVMARVQGVSVRRSGGLGSNTRFALNGLTDDQIRFFFDGLP
jgi:outer membrane cobalamin receptor